MLVLTKKRSLWFPERRIVRLPSYIIGSGLIGGGGAASGPPPFSNTRSLSLNGVDQSVNGGNIYNFERTDSWTISAWVKLSDVTNYKPIVVKQLADSGFRGWQFVTQGSQVGFCIDGGNANYMRVWSPASLVTNTWTHVAASYNGNGLASGVTLYINGSSVSKSIESDNVDGNSIQSTASLYVGYWPAAGSYTSGLLDQVAIFTSVLSAGQLTTIYGSGHEADISSLSPATDLEFENNFTDSGSNAFTFSGVNSPTFSTSVP
jgi:hypothetical protein